MKVFLRRMLISFLLLGAAWIGGFAWYSTQIPRTQGDDQSVTDAIVVLTGGSGRIRYGLQLLADGKATKLFITGVESAHLTPQQIVKQYNPEAAGKLGRDALVVLGYDARNTIGNAMETSTWMKREGLHSLRLVTANYHMPRAIKEFHFAMPQATIIPDAVLPEDFKIDDWWKSGGSSQLLLREYHKYMAACARHWLMKAVGEEV